MTVRECWFLLGFSVGSLLWLGLGFAWASGLRRALERRESDPW